MPFRKIKVLLAEDEGVVAMNTISSLMHMGFDVAGVALSGRSTVQKALESSPDVVLMDIRLQGEMDGIEAARIIHERLGTPVIYLTGNSDPATYERAMQSPNKGYLSKPVDDGDLRDAINKALEPAV